MSYTPEEYEELKSFYKKDLEEQKKIQERMRLARLRKQAEWHLHQMEASLRSLGIEPHAPSEESPPPLPPSELPPSDKTFL
ncbi:MAG: hypothetical protein N2170_03620 [Bacteroidia bacterium]|nr:hypothetical protein [Bacteroidia bacterium]